MNKPPALPEVMIEKAGEYTLQIHPEIDHWQPMNLRYVELKRQ